MAPIKLKVSPQPTDIGDPTVGRKRNNPVKKEIDQNNVETMGWNTLLYRTSQELDTYAAPTIDWVVNRQSLPAGTTATIVVSVWISATGYIDHFQIEQQNPSGNWAHTALASLQTTAMEPATLGGTPVASKMTLEISIDNHF